jgi:hypothetical protein
VSRCLRVMGVPVVFIGCKFFIEQPIKPGFKDLVQLFLLEAEIHVR